MIKKRDWRKKNKTKNSKRLINRIYIIHSQIFFILLYQKYIYLFIMKMFCFNIYLRKSRNKEKRECECEEEEEGGRKIGNGRDDKIVYL